MQMLWVLRLILGALNVASGVRDRRVIGGEPVGIQQAKYMVQLVKYNFTIRIVNYFCGGALIRHDWVLTAAHCVRNRCAADLRAIGNSGLKYGFDRRAVNVFQIYLPESMYNNIRRPDVGLLKLSEPLIGPNVGIVDYDSTPVPTGALLDTYGWGLIEAGTPSTVLRYGQLLTMSNELCRELFQHLHIEEAMICTGHPSKYAITTGDSGSPLLRNNRIVAIASVNSKRNVMVGVSMRIEYFVEWIEATLAARTADGVFCTLP